MDCAVHEQNYQRQQQHRLRRFVFTLNNWTEAEWNYITTVFIHYCLWMIVGKEVGENETPHLQGACILLPSRQIRFSQLKTTVGFARAHVEVMRGEPAASQLYCSKQDLHPFVYGTLPTPGKRNDIHNAVNIIKSGKRLRELIEDDETCITFVKYHKGLSLVRHELAPRRDPSATPPEIIWMYGKTGLGKTKCAWKYAVARFGHSEIWMSSDQRLQWFNGYDGHRIAIFDDFRARKVPFNLLLRVTDRYPLKVPVKGSDVSWCPDVIIFTSPYDIRTMFSVRLEHLPEDIAQFERRVTDVYNFDLPRDRQLFKTLIRECRDGGRTGEAQ